MKTTNKKFKLLDLATIQTGIYRKRVAGGTVHQIQKSNFGEHGELLPLPRPPEFPREDRLEKHYLTGGEVLVTAKGDTNAAYLFPSLEEPAVASSMFLVIRLKSQAILPAYLNWYLNTSHGQRQLAQRSRGSAVNSLSIRDLKALPVALPPLATQTTLLYLTELQRKEQTLYQQIATTRRRLHEAMLLQLITPTPQP